MNKFINKLISQKKYYDTLIQEVQKEINMPYPDGNIRISKSNGNDQFYLCTQKGDNKGKYLKKSERDTAINIIKRDYCREVLKCATDWSSWLDRFIRTMPTKKIEQIYEKSGRRKYIAPYSLSDDEYRTKWEAVTFIGKPFDKDAPEIYSEKGERVRSKSEKMIADKLFFMGIPYRYEFPLELDNRRMVYPDFTILNVVERKEYRMEHFGMMDNLPYVEKTIRKINNYTRNGYYAGENMIYTFETKTTPIDMMNFQRLAERYFLS